MPPAKPDKKPRCQCTPSCKRPPLENSPFCSVHLKSCPRQALLSGNEYPFQPEKYNKHTGIRESHNCFAYAFGYLHLPKTKKCTKDSCPLPYPQPGRASGYPKWSNVDGKRCPDLVARFMGDVPGIKPSTFEARCPKGMRKIAPVVAPKDDYHFYRQDANGYWSHKPGATHVTHLDATKRPIYDPQLASRDYPSSGLDYNEFCGYWCIPTRKRFHFGRGGSRRRRHRHPRKTRKASS